MNYKQTRLLELIGFESNLLSGLEIAMANSGLSVSSKRVFLDTFTNNSAFRSEICEVISTIYTEDEIDALIAFYQSPVGIKCTNCMPILMEKGNEIGIKYAQLAMAKISISSFP